MPGPGEHLPQGRIDWEPTEKAIASGGGLFFKPARMPSGERPLKTAFKPFKGAGMGVTAGLCTKWVKNGLLAALKPIHLDDVRRQGQGTLDTRQRGKWPQPMAPKEEKWKGWKVLLSTYIETFRTSLAAVRFHGSYE